MSEGISLIYNEDCLEGMKRLADNSVDCIICDLPYNLTDCAWDKKVLDLAAMWTEFKRILKPYNSVVLFASGKFTYKLISSNYDWYKYKWIWMKNQATMFVQAKNAPMRRYEEILVFSDGVINHASCSKRRMKYNPQGVVPCENGGMPQPKHKGANIATRGIFKPYKGEAKPSQLRAGGRGSKYPVADNYAYHCHGDWQKGRSERWRQNIQSCYGDCGNELSNWYIQEQTGYPSDILKFKAEPNNGRYHPTQKPVTLLEYLVRTYTNEGETVLDATMGSGSTGVAAINTGRKFIGFELEEKYYKIAQERIAKAIAEREQKLF